MSKKSIITIKVEEQLASVNIRAEALFKKLDDLLKEKDVLGAEKSLLESLLETKIKPARKHKAKPEVSNETAPKHLPIEENIVKRQQPLDEWAREKVAQTEKTVRERGSDDDIANN